MSKRVVILGALCAALLLPDLARAGTAEITRASGIVLGFQAGVFIVVTLDDGRVVKFALTPGATIPVDLRPGARVMLGFLDTGAGPAVVDLMLLGVSRSERISTVRSAPAGFGDVALVSESVAAAAPSVRDVDVRPADEALVAGSRDALRSVAPGTALTRKAQRPVSVNPPARSPAGVVTGPPAGAVMSPGETAATGIPLALSIGSPDMPASSPAPTAGLGR